MDDYEPDPDDYEPDPDPMDDYEPDPTDHPDFERYEYERQMARLTPVGRLRARIRGFIWHYTWKWRIKPNCSEPPF